ncbi:MAG: hypothetical protein ACK47B_05270 [Armatimonadota bacterium]
MVWLIIALVGFGWLAVRFDLLSMARILVRFSRLGAPAEIRLQPLSRPAWRHAGRVEALLGELRGLDFEEGPHFRVLEIPGMTLQLLFHHEERVYAAIYEAPLVGTILDFDTHYADGTSVTYTTSKEGIGQEDPPGRRKVRLPGLSAAELFHRLVRDRPLGEIPPLDTRRVQELVQRDYADEMLWRSSRGGPTAAEILAMAEAQGRSYPAEVVAQSRKVQFEQAMRSLNTTLRKRLPGGGDSAGPVLMADAQLVYIHDDLTPELLSELVGRLTGTEVAPESPGAGPARQLFPILNSRLPQERRFRKVGELQEPLPGDVYALPGVTPGTR